MKAILTCLMLSAAVSPARAEALDGGIVDIRVEGNKLEATIQASNVLSAELTIGFDNVVGLSAESLGLSAVVLNPLDAVLLQRLGNAAISIPQGFPVLVRIEPLATGGFPSAGSQPSSCIRTTCNTKQTRRSGCSPRLRAALSSM